MRHQSVLRGRSFPWDWLCSSAHQLRYSFVVTFVEKAHKGNTQQSDGAGRGNICKWKHMVWELVKLGACYITCVEIMWCLQAASTLDVQTIHFLYLWRQSSSLASGLFTTSTQTSSAMKWPGRILQLPFHLASEVHSEMSHKLTCLLFVKKWNENHTCMKHVCDVDFWWWWRMVHFQQQCGCFLLV